MISEADLKYCMAVVRLTGARSRAIRAKVGCIIWHVQKRTIISMGYNGTLPGDDNVMEIDDKTLPHVRHAEQNALEKLSFWHRGRGLMLMVTHTPCLRCAKSIVKRGIQQVYYLDNYGDAAGLKWLREHNVKVMRLAVS
jgi:dCMP deaminase